jgi:hypothetical protein
MPGDGAKRICFHKLTPLFSFPIFKLWVQIMKEGLGDFSDYLERSTTEGDCHGNRDIGHLPFFPG